MLIDPTTRIPLPVPELVRTRVSEFEGVRPVSDAALDAVDRILNRGGDADDVLRAVVAALVERGGCAWAGILFAENGELILGPEAGEPDPDARRRTPVVYEGSQRGRARHRRLRRRRLPRPRRAADLGLLPGRLGHRRRPLGSRRLSVRGARAASGRRTKSDTSQR